MRVAWFTPYPESHPESCAAYASELLLPVLKSQLELEIFSNRAGEIAGLAVEHYLAAFRRHQDNPFDVLFYQLENSNATRWMRIQLGTMPGMVWFHDFTLSDDGPEPILNSGWSEFVRKFSDPERPWPERGAEFQKVGKLALREGALSVVPLFSNQKSLNDFQNSRTVSFADGLAGYDYQPLYLPLPVSPHIESARGEPGLVAYCGSPSIECRAHKVLAALQDMHAVTLRWVVSQNEIEKAGALLDEFQCKNVEIISNRTPALWAEVTAQASAAIHTQFSAFGSTSPYLEISLMRGLPSLVCNFGESENLPETIVFKVNAGDAETFEVSESLSAILTAEVAVHQQAIRSFAIEHFSTPMVAQELIAVFEHSAAYQREFQARWGAFEQGARASLLQEAALLVRDETGMIPDVFGQSLKSSYLDLGWEECT